MPLRTRAVLLSVSAFIVVVSAAPSHADHDARPDPRDTPGRLDIRRTAHRHGADGELVHRIETYGRFPSRWLTREEGIQLSMVITPAGEGSTSVEIRWRNGALRAILLRVYGIGDVRRVGVAEVHRPSRRSVVVALLLEDLVEDPMTEPSRYFWDAYALDMKGPQCVGIDDGCFEFSGRLRHQLAS